MRYGRLRGGLFLWNSEVGKRSVGLQTFWFQARCQTQTGWDAVEVIDFSRKHTANVRDALRDIRSLFHELVDRRVTVPTDVADVLDSMLSPIDAAEAIDEIVPKLPTSHRSSVLARLFRRFGLVRVCVGRLAWCGVEFSYVETDGRFLVLDAWETGSRRSGRVTCVLNGSEPVAGMYGAAAAHA